MAEPRAALELGGGLSGGLSGGAEGGLYAERMVPQVPRAAPDEHAAPAPAIGEEAVDDLSSGGGRRSAVGDQRRSAEISCGRSAEVGGDQLWDGVGEAMQARMQLALGAAA